MNRTLEAMLSAHVNEYHTDRDDYLQRCSLACRSSIHSSTCENPAMLMFRQELQLPVDLMFASPTSKVCTIRDYVPKLRQCLRVAFHHARSPACAAQHWKSIYDIKA